MVTRRDWYARVNEAWPSKPPALTAPEAIRAARKLHRFVLGRTWEGDIKLTSGNRYTWERRGVLYINPSRGWHHLIHDLSHLLHRRRYRGSLLPAAKPHSKAHARLELRMRKEAIRRGWLEGALADEPAKAPQTAQEAPPSAELPKPRPNLPALRYARTLAAIGRWEAKAKRARNALRKLGARRRYYERRNAVHDSESGAVRA